MAGFNNLSNDIKSYGRLLVV